MKLWVMTEDPMERFVGDVLPHEVRAAMTEVDLDEMSEVCWNRQQVASDYIERVIHFAHIEGK